MGEKEKTAKQLEIAHRSKRALELRLTGLSLRQIAAEIGVSVFTAHKDVNRALRDIPKEEADALRAQETERLDMAQHAIWTEVLAGDLAAIDRLVKIVDRRARLLGLDAPTSVEVGASSAEVDAAVRALLDAAQGGNTQPAAGEVADGDS